MRCIHDHHINNQQIWLRTPEEELKLENVSKET